MIPLSVARELVEINHPYQYACPPQWLPVLLAMHSKGADAAAQPTAAFAAAPSPPQPSPPPCTFSRGGAVSFPPDPNRCKVTLKIEARLLSSLRPCTHLPPTHAYTLLPRHVPTVCDSERVAGVLSIQRLDVPDD